MCLHVSPGQGQSFQGLGDLDGGGFDSNAESVSADGLIVVGYSANTLGFQAFHWTLETGMVGLGDLIGGTHDGIALGVSADGSVIVGSSEGAAGLQAFRWTAQTLMVPIGDLPAGLFSSEARGVSTDGSMIVGHGNAEQIIDGVDVGRLEPVAWLNGLPPQSLISLNST